MNEGYVQQRIRDIQDAYEKNGKTKDYEITLVPLNKNGDVHVKLMRLTKIKERLIREKIILKGEDLNILAQEH